MVIAATLNVGQITLDAGDGGTLQAVDGLAPYNSSVGIRFNTDGTVETRAGVNGGASWVSAGTWIDPTSAASGSYDVRFTNLVQNIGSTDWTTEAAADDTWIALSAQRTWVSESTTLDSWDFDCDFETRLNAGGINEGSSAYSFVIDNTA